MKLGIWGFSGTQKSFPDLFSGFHKILARNWLYLAKACQMNLICPNSSEWDETWYLEVFGHPKVISGLAFGIQQNPDTQLAISGNVEPDQPGSQNLCLRRSY